MAISVVSTSSGSIGAAATSLAINAPASIAVGDVLIAVLAIDGGSNNTMTLPAGWTSDLDYSRGTAIKILISHRVVDGTEGASFTWQTSAARAGSFTLALIAQSTDGGAFASRETADKPQLIITP